MDINRLEYFCAIVKTGSLKDAAELLHVTPAALSKAIRILESELDAKLLIPSGRGIAVTDFGKQVAMKAEKLIIEINALRFGSSESRRELEKPFRIGSFEVFTTHFLGALMEGGFQGTPLTLQELVPGKMEEAISQGNIDVGVTYIPVPKPDLDLVKILDIEMAVYGAGERFQDEAFEELPFVVPVTPIAGSPNKVKGLDGWPDHVAPRNIIHQVTLMESALELCRRGQVVAYLPSFVVRLHNETVIPSRRLQKVRILQNKFIQKQAVYLIKRKSDLESPLFKKLAKVIRTSCR